MPEDVELWGGAPCAADLTRIGFVARLEERPSAADHGCGDPAAMIRIAMGMPALGASPGSRLLRKATRRRRADQRIATAGSAARPRPAAR